jgi:hypothetical protein
VPPFLTRNGHNNPRLATTSGTSIRTRRASIKTFFAQLNGGCSAYPEPQKAVYGGITSEAKAVGEGVPGVIAVSDEANEKVIDSGSWGRRDREAELTVFGDAASGTRVPYGNLVPPVQAVFSVIGIPVSTGSTWQ